MWRLSANKREFLFVDSLETSRLRVHGRCKQKTTDKGGLLLKDPARGGALKTGAFTNITKSNIYISSAEGRPVLCVRKIRMILESTPPSCSAPSEHPINLCPLPIVFQASPPEIRPLVLRKNPSGRAARPVGK